MSRLNPIQRGFLLILKHTLNPLTRRLGRLPFGPVTLVRHVGRRSGKTFETPIMVARVPQGFVIELTYGPDVDWHKNMLAAGGCTLVFHGRDYRIDRIEPLDAATGRAAFPLPARLILALLHRTHFELLRPQAAAPATGRAAA